jgi:predicted RNA-binding protein YlqC (UPF0109 family)
MEQQSNNPAEEVGKALLAVLKALTREHQHLKLNGVPYGRSYLFQARASKSDTPKLVGERARTVRALSSLVELMGRRHRQTMQFQLLEPEVGHPGRMQPFMRQETWDAHPTEELAMQVAGECLIHPPLRVVTTNQPNYVSQFTVVANNEERQEVIDALREPFAVIFNAIGKAKGRILQPDVLHERDLNNSSNSLAPISFG